MNIKKLFSRLELYDKFIKIKKKLLIIIMIVFSILDNGILL